jgi:Tol biopolymer transport system component
MGEVYRATDTHLGREVAIKVLPDAFAHDPERLARFEREARTLAALNHPNIAAIYGVESSPSTGSGQAGIHALVMELVEGPTLADRLVHGALPIDEALAIAKQIAEALEAAHDHGIVHRDLKPANIKVRTDGTVKVLDFGLAKTLDAREASGLGGTAGASLSPTITTPAMTQMGMILGTASYMSPEQARGHSVDRASDIWAFGCVLYEMLGGRLAFAGETITDVLGGIVRVDPDWSALPADIPDTIRALVRHCLQKDRKRRLKDIGDARVEIEDALAADGSSVRAAKPIPARTHARWAWVAGGGVLAVIAAVSLPLALVHVREPAPDDRAIRFDVILPDKVTQMGAPPAISPDGRRLAFVANLAGRTQVWIRSLDSAVAQPLTGTDGADYPFWSPDSRFIGFFAGGKLRKIDASGGPPQVICDAPLGRGGAWNEDGVIVFAPTAAGPLSRVASAGGIPKPVTTLDVSNGEVYHRSPSFLPDGRRFLFLVQGSETSNGIHVGSLDSEGHRLVLNATSSGVFIAAGYLLFVRERTLMAQRLDVGTLALTGDAFPVAESVGLYSAVSATFSVSANGVLAYTSGTGGIGGSRQLTWFDRAGNVVERIRSQMPLADVALSPDGRQAAVQFTANNQDIWVVDLIRAGVPSRLTFNPAVEDFPVWSPDGHRILYTSTAGGGQNLYSKLASGAGSEEDVLKSAAIKRPTDWSPSYILFEEDNPNSQADLWALPLSGDKKPMLVLGTPFSEMQGRLSPDGKWMAYISNETGSVEVYVQSFPPSAGKWQLSSGGGVTPRWRRDGRELFYLAPDRKIMSVDVSTNGATFEHGSPRALFEAPVDAVNTTATNRYDVSADGKRFLVNASIENVNVSTAPITIVVNWLAGLKSQR